MSGQPEVETPAVPEGNAGTLALPFRLNRYITGVGLVGGPRSAFRCSRQL